ncbi:hypothetical protein HanOQP8_Chr11g0423811 [Helianthus annuus]|nr:hypothetical protein HanOQP8_Chr11g0423811 [Helianthus annuus]
MQAPQNTQNFSDAIKRLDEVSVSCKGEERVRLLKSWLKALRECEKPNGNRVEYEGKISEDPHTSSDKNVSPGKPAMVSEKRGYDFPCCYCIQLCICVM